VEEHLEDEDEEDVYILSKVGDVVHALFSTHRDAFLPAFERLLPHFTRLLQPGRPWSDLQWGLCIFDDLLEYTGNQPPQKQCDPDPKSDLKHFAGSGVGSGMNHFGSGSGQPLSGMNLKQNFSDKIHNFSTKCTFTGN
jgi:hypothetical protein